MPDQEGCSALAAAVRAAETRMEWRRFMARDLRRSCHKRSRLSGLFSGSRRYRQADQRTAPTMSSVTSASQIRPDLVLADLQRSQSIGGSIGALRDCATAYLSMAHRKLRWQVEESGVTLVRAELR